VFCIDPFQLVKNDTKEEKHLRTTYLRLQVQLDEGEDGYMDGTAVDATRDSLGGG